MNGVTAFDLGPLIWVKSEIDAALDRAADAFAQYRKADGDLTQLKFCRTHLHQVHGALSIVALDGVTQVTEALENLLLALEEGRPVVGDTVAAVEMALAAVRLYLDELMAGEPNQPLRLLAVYQALIDARGGARSRPADLFFPDLSVRPPKSSDAAVQLDAGSFRQYLKNERMRFQKGLLALLRNPVGSELALAGLTQMKQALQTIEATQESPAARSFWWVSRGFLDALADRGLAAEMETRQLCARIDLQIRRLLEGSRNVAERLMRDALYYVGQSQESGEVAAQVRRVSNSIVCCRARKTVLFRRRRKPSCGACAKSLMRPKNSGTSSVAAVPRRCQILSNKRETVRRRLRNSRIPTSSDLLRACKRLPTGCWNSQVANPMWWQWRWRPPSSCCKTRRKASNVSVWISLVRLT